MDEKMAVRSIDAGEERQVFPPQSTRGAESSRATVDRRSIERVIYDRARERRVKRERR